MLLQLQDAWTESVLITIKITTIRWNRTRRGKKSDCMIEQFDFLNVNRFVVIAHQQSSSQIIRMFYAIHKWYTFILCIAYHAIAYYMYIYIFIVIILAQIVSSRARVFRFVQVFTEYIFTLCRCSWLHACVYGCINCYRCPMCECLYACVSVRDWIWHVCVCMHVCASLYVCVCVYVNDSVQGTYIQFRFG